MFAGIADFWSFLEAPAANKPAPPRRHAPVLMTDILVSRGDQPELLIRWREDRDALDHD